MSKGKKILFLGVYGMEVVECGGALAKNVLNGGESYASIMLCRETSQPQVRNAAEILGVKISFLNFEYGTVDLSKESKIKLIKLIREVKAMDMLESQMEFSGMHFDEILDSKTVEILSPGYSQLKNHQEKGRAMHRVLDKAVHVYHGLATHGHFALAEAYRREGNFHLQELIK